MPKLINVLAVAPLTALIIATMATIALGHTVEKGNIEIIHPWVEPSSGPNALAHPTVSNERGEDITLLRIETPVAQRVVLFRGGKEINQIVIPPDDIISFDADPYSMELQGLLEPLKDGGEFPGTFHFSGDLTIELQMVIGESTMPQDMDMASMVRSTDPSDGAVLSRSPEHINITFAHPVRLTILKLSTIFGEVIPVEFDQVEEGTADIAVPVPPLDPDDYTVEWRALGGDDHAMSGSFSFTVTTEN